MQLTLFGDAIHALESRCSMSRRMVFRLGLLAPFILVFTVILGGALRPGYSHVSDTMSELFSPGSPNRLLLSAFYTLYGISISVFGFGLLQFVQDRGEFKTIGKTAAMAFISVGVLNILTATVFPQDAWGSFPTFPGTMHMILGGVVSLLSILYTVLFGIWVQRLGFAKFFTTYSIATVIGAVIAAGWFVASYGSALMGISERVAALIGFQWTVIFAGILLNHCADATRESC